MALSKELQARINHYYEFASTTELDEMNIILDKMARNKKDRQIRVSWSETNMGGYYASRTKRPFVKWLFWRHNNSSSLKLLESYAKELGLTIRLID